MNKEEFGVPATNLKTKYAKEFKTIINTMDYGFEVFVKEKKGQNLKRFVLTDDFKNKVKTAIQDTIQNTFMSEESEYAQSQDVADNQNKYYVFQQDSFFHPLRFFETSYNDNNTFRMAERDNVEALLFRFKRDDKIIWAYQVIRANLIPNKKGQCFLAKVLSTENVETFIQMTDSLFPITSEVKLLIIDDAIICDDLNFMKRHFHYFDVIKKKAREAIKTISRLEIVVNIKKMEDYITSHESHRCLKLMQIPSYSVISQDKTITINAILNSEIWKDKFTINNDRIVLKTNQDVENLIDLFDERYTKSPITNDVLDTDVKKRVPSGQAKKIKDAE